VFHLHLGCAGVWDAARRSQPTNQSEQPEE
jgi:hypothetical protein